MRHLLPTRLAYALAAFCLALGVGSGSVLAANAATGDSLGISVQVELAAGKSATNLNGNNKLWFVIKPGGRGERSFLVRSSSNLSQRITLKVAARKQVNGDLQLDPTGKTPVGAWAAFSPNGFILPAHSVHRVRMVIHVPRGAAITSYQPALLVQASAATGQKAQYSVPTALQFAQGMFVGVGTSKQIPIGFSIDDVYGQNSVNGHQIVIGLTNRGKTPLALSGTIQFSSVAFQGLTIGPLNFITQTIQPGAVMHATIPAPAKLTEGQWNVYVEASQGEVKETKTFQGKAISFRGTDYLLVSLYAGGAILLSLIIALVSIRILREIRAKEQRERDEAERVETEREAERARLAALEAELARLQAKSKPREKTESKPGKKAGPKKVSTRKPKPPAD